jgi:hypothetical protein
MTRTELELKLNTLNINSSLYSLEGDLNPNSIILYNSYDNWIVFYLDERGGRNDERIFESQELAYDYIYVLFKKEKKSA